MEVKKLIFVFFLLLGTKLMAQQNPVPETASSKYQKKLEKRGLMSMLKGLKC